MPLFIVLPLLFYPSAQHIHAMELPAYDHMECTKNNVLPTSAILVAVALKRSAEKRGLCGILKLGSVPDVTGMVLLELKRQTDAAAARRVARKRHRCGICFNVDLSTELSECTECCALHCESCAGASWSDYFGEHGRWCYGCSPYYNDSSDHESIG